MTATMTDRRTNLFKRATTPVLVTSLLAVEADSTNRENKMVRAWIIQELERRHPAASAAVEAAFDADEAALMRGEDTPGVDYVAVLLAHIPGAA